VYEKRPNTCSDFPVRIARLVSRDVLTICVCRALEGRLVDSHLDSLEELGLEIFKRQTKRTSK